MSSPLTAGPQLPSRSLTSYMIQQLHNTSDTRCNSCLTGRGMRTGRGKEKSRREQEGEAEGWTSVLGVHQERKERPSPGKHSNTDISGAIWY
jgi:hypothetical protein